MSDKLLTAEEASSAVRQLVASPSSAMKALHHTLRETFGGQRVVVLGSAPQAVLPGAGTFDRLVCVNGSGSVARGRGLVPDATVIVGYLTASDRGVSPASRAALAGCETARLLFVSAGHAFDDGLATLRAVGFQYGSATEIDPIERAAIIESLCGVPLGLGRRDDRMSNGMFAVALMLWAGATDVVLAGFSLEGGHAYQPDTPRFHLDGDGRFLGLVRIRFPQVSTTAQALAASAGLPLFQAAP